MSSALSAYELQRLDNIQANQRALADLGLPDAAAAVRKVKPRVERSRPPPRPPPESVRKSSRVQNLPKRDYTEVSETSALEPQLFRKKFRRVDAQAVRVRDEPPLRGAAGAATSSAKALPPSQQPFSAARRALRTSRARLSVQHRVTLPAMRRLARRGGLRRVTRRELGPSAPYYAAPVVPREGGLDLRLSSRSATGYEGVVRHCVNGRVSFKAQGPSDGGRKTLGYFGTAVEAAVTYARHCAELEASSGLGSGSGPGAGERGRRMRGPSSTGYLGVYRWAEGQQGKPFSAFSPRQGDARVRFSDGVILHWNERNSTGYEGVAYARLAKPFRAVAPMVDGLPGAPLARRCAASAAA
ncbi:hypothetical protein EMIHUDRAFT_458471 [Emiliania huxleyi CCMP1516]|uniref:AP2/ERF domain-containing protein n=2 Tax=Emiliania huxleyi TaxID=2903 RepID=A0A0D3JC76_EMIH1|nr:hypothetical protein EMIHUDRAFT_458471 [Emiliania huxleyi CCMP1516]EOD21111.1 hypothetical protein EMIHUDRAFT_458471 [Emiliania huxleyi CCMP1516]|eukprot:XP_005773540.1 hypothetical protein EMIHUDRAFT_458471 [Emiliania huxleyi CCMP1516]